MGKARNEDLFCGTKGQPRLSLDKETAERIADEVYEKMHDVPPEVVDEQERLIGELEAYGIKCDRKELVDIFREKDGRIVRLTMGEWDPQKGRYKNGLRHIMQRHSGDFKRKFDIEPEEIASLIKTFMTKGDLVYIHIDEITNKERYRIYEYKGKSIRVALSDEGKIVTSHPNPNVSNEKKAEFQARQRNEKTTTF